MELVHVSDWQLRHKGRVTQASGKKITHMSAGSDTLNCILLNKETKLARQIIGGSLESGLIFIFPSFSSPKKSCLRYTSSQKSLALLRTEVVLCQWDCTLEEFTYPPLKRVVVTL